MFDREDQDQRALVELTALPSKERELTCPRQEKRVKWDLPNQEMAEKLGKVEAGVLPFCTE